MATSEADHPLGFNPQLRVFGFGVFLFTSLLLFSGGYTTTIGAGMIFPDWPLSNGSLNPEGWLTNQAMAAEHSHRLFGATVGLLTLILTFWTWSVEPRKWVRRTATVMLSLVVLQGLLGGLRVLGNSTTLAMVHGCTAQLFLCSLVTMILAHIPRFRGESAQSEGHKTLGWLTPVLFVLVLAQLVIAAAMRHQGAGLAIPTFPLTPSGGLIPDAWPSAVTLHFAHRAMALVITLAAAFWAWRFFRSTPKNAPVVPYATGFLVLLGAQIVLGALTIWTTRHPIVTTLHVLTGAYLLAFVWALTFSLARVPRLGVFSPSRLSRPSPAGAGQASTLSLE